MNALFKLCIFFFLLISYEAQAIQGLMGKGGSLGFTFMNFEYEEPTVMTEKGTLPGVEFNANFKLFSKLQLDIDAEYYSGNLQYDGSTLDTNIPVTTETEDVLYQGRVRIGPVIDSFRFYVGYGYRKWENDLVISYRRYTTYQYVPVGIEAFFKSKGFGIQAESMVFQEGLNESFLGDLTGFGYTDIEMKQNSGSGFRVSLWIPFSVSKSDLLVKFFYRSWDVDPSETAVSGSQTFIEPLNNTRILGASLQVMF